MIYKNPLGEPDPRATVSIFGGIFEAPYYAMSVTSDAPIRKWAGDTPVQDIVADMEADGWLCATHKNGLGQIVIDCLHAETQALIDEIKAKQTEKFAGAERGYIRFGELPEGGYSWNFRDDRPEAGVSCFDAEIAPDGSFRLILTPVLKASYLTVSMRQPYRLYGEVRKVMRI